MPTAIETRLHELGDALRAASPTISIEELGGTVIPIEFAAKQRNTGRIVAAVLTSAAAVAGTVVMVGAISGNDTSGTPSTQRVSAVGDGRMVLDPLPEGWMPVMASDVRVGGQNDFLKTRLYTSASERPEEDPVLTVELMPDGYSTPAVPDSAIDVDDGGKLYTDDVGWRTIAVHREGKWLVVAGRNITDAQLKLAFTHAHPDGGEDWAAIDPVALPDGTVDRGVGVRGETFEFLDAYNAASPTTSWSNGDRAIRVVSFIGEDTASVQRLWMDPAGEINLDGTPATRLTIVGQPTFHGLVWAQAGRSYLVTSNGLTADEMTSLAARLRPATSIEWDALVRLTAPPIATIDPATGLPPVGSLIPTKVKLFPTIEESLVPGANMGPTYAYFTYAQPGIETAGTAWRGGLGNRTDTSVQFVVGITVADPASAGQIPLEPGRTPDITEYDHGSGAEIGTTVDGYAVTLQGTDKDLLYDLIDQIQPTTNNGRLSGYRITGPLPDGLAEIAGPTELGWAQGSFPAVHVHNGAITMTVRPTSMVDAARELLGSQDLVETPLGSAIVYQSDENDYVQVAIDLADGSTLVASTASLDRDQLLDLVSHIQLVDESTWRSIYTPRDAIIPRIVAATAADTPVD